MSYNLQVVNLMVIFDKINAKFYKVIIVNEDAHSPVTFS